MIPGGGRLCGPGAGFSASPGGSIVFLTAADSLRFYNYDRAGNRLAAVGTPGAYLNFTLAADGRSLLADRMQPMFGTYDIWEIELAHGVETRLTSSPAAEFSPLLLPGGKTMIYSVARAGTPNLVRRTRLAGEEETLLPSSGFQEAYDISPAGDLLTYSERGETGGFHGQLLELGPPARRRPSPFPASSEQGWIRFSPDGRYLVFTANESGQFEVYLMPLASPEERVRLSQQGATRVRWRRDGREIVWLSPRGELVSVAVKLGPKLELGEPKVLFSLPAEVKAQDFDLTSDGNQLILLLRERRGGAQPAAVVLDWAP